MSNLQQIGRHCTTIAGTTDGYTVVTYHSTQVVKFNSREIWLNHGGYMTATTKMRMNQASNQFELGYRVYAKGGNWYIDYNGQTLPYIGQEMVLRRQSLISKE